MHTRFKALLILSFLLASSFAFADLDARRASFMKAAAECENFLNAMDLAAFAKTKEGESLRQLPPALQSKQLEHTKALKKEKLQILKKEFEDHYGTAQKLMKGPNPQVEHSQKILKGGLDLLAADEARLREICPPSK